MKDSERLVRIASILSLGRVGNDSQLVHDTLAGLARDPDPGISLNAVVALACLGKFDDGVVPILVQALSNEEEPTAKAAARALGGLGSKDPDRILIQMPELLGSSQERVVGFALRVLRQMKTKAAPALPQIAALFERSNGVSRMNVIEALTAIDDTGDYAIPLLAKALKQTDSAYRKEALLGLMRFRSKGEGIVEPLTEVLKDQDPENRLLAVAVIRGMGQQGAPAAKQMAELVTDPDLRVRNSAINALVVYRPVPPEVFPALEKALQDDNPRVRISAVNALRLLKPDYSSKVVQMLSVALHNERHGPTRKQIESALQQTDNQ